MPIKRETVYEGVKVTWEGPAVTRRIRNGIRAALITQATGAQILARELVNIDTQALHDAIAFKVYRGRGGVYRLEFGVFDDPNNRPRVTYYVAGFDFPVSKESALNMPDAALRQGSGGGRVEMPQDYAFWQEVDPERGNPYIRPAVDAFLTEQQLFLAIADNVFYTRSGYGDDPNFDISLDAQSFGFDQSLGGE